MLGNTGTSEVILPFSMLLSQFIMHLNCIWIQPIFYSFVSIQHWLKHGMISYFYNGIILHQNPVPKFNEFGDDAMRDNYLIS